MKGLKKLSAITKYMVIGDVLDKKPEAQNIIAKYFGMGCFTCPGVRMESLELGASIHGFNVDDLVNEINALDDEK